MSIAFNNPIALAAGEKISQQVEEKSAKLERLHNVAKDFESVMLSQIFKSGLETAKELSAQEEDAAGGQWKSMANEQLATHVSKQISGDLAESLYQRLEQSIIGAN